MAPDSLIIVLTGIATEKDVQDCVRAGADAVFLKLDIVPVENFMERLKKIVLELMKRPRARETNLRILETVAQKIAEQSKQPLHPPQP